jgi:hypothetical protein
MALGNNAIQVLDGTVVDDDENLYANTLSANVTTWLVQGVGASNYGYALGNTTDPGTPWSFSAAVERFPYASPSAPSASVGNLTVGRVGGGMSSADYAYVGGGHAPGAGSANTRIDRLAFASSITNATLVGALSAARGGVAGISSPTYGYVSGGFNSAFEYNFAPPWTFVGTIDRFPFALAITNASSVGTLSANRCVPGGMSSSSYGYTAGGASGTGGYPNTTIDRFPFALSITNAADVGDLAADKTLHTQGLQSTDYGYTAGWYDGYPPGTFGADIQYFPFALSITNAAGGVNLSEARGEASTQSFIYHGYVSGGQNAPSFSSKIDRFPFAALASNASSVGNLLSTGETTGAQY